MAYIQCQDFVSQRLVSPGSADFPWLDYQADRVEDRYEVRSYVDSQNRFGAELRTNFRCLIRYRGGEDADPRSWELLDLTLVE